MRDTLMVRAFYPGRMAPQTALCFLLAGITLAIICKPRRSEFARLIPGLLGGMVFAFGLLACFGYAFGWQIAYSWKPFADMAVHTAAGFVMLSLGAMNYTWRPYLTEMPAAVPRLPIAVGVGVVVMTIGLWQALLANEHKVIRKTIGLAATNVQTELVTQINSRIEELVYITARWESSDSLPSRQIWESDVMRFQQHDPYLQSIAWVDTAQRDRWLQSRQDQNSAIFSTLHTIVVKSRSRASWKGYSQVACRSSSPFFQAQILVVFSLVGIKYDLSSTRSSPLMHPTLP
jgi:hypothetical protein